VNAAPFGARAPGCLPVLISVHDVMPHTLAAVERIVARLEARAALPATLLVVPGRAWDAATLRRLQRLVGRGCELAAHGWRHDTARWGNLAHRLHGAVLSGRVAEHLTLGAAGVIALVLRSHAWFGRHELPAPALYVPPAWALGPVRAAALRLLPFTRYETLSGLLVAPGGRIHPLPLVGFEADTAARVPALRLWNACHLAWARRSGRALRVAIHPHDLELALAPDLERLLTRPLWPLAYSHPGAAA